LHFCQAVAHAAVHAEPEGQVLVAEYLIGALLEMQTAPV